MINHETKVYHVCLFLIAHNTHKRHYYRIFQYHIRIFRKLKYKLKYSVLLPFEDSHDAQFTYMTVKQPQSKAMHFLKQNWLAEEYIIYHSLKYISSENTIESNLWL